MVKRPKSRPTILAVDDDLGILESFHLILDDSYEVLDSPDAVTGLATIASRTVELVLLDVLMDDIDGVMFLEQMALAQRHVPVVVVSALQNPDMVATMMRLGAVDYVTKPFTDEQLHGVVASAIGRDVSLPRKPRVLLANCAPGLAAGIIVLFSECLDIEIIGTASELATYLATTPPDLVIADTAGGRSAADLFAVVDTTALTRPVILLGGPPLPSPGLRSRYASLQRPIAFRDLLTAVSDALPSSLGSKLRVSDRTLRIVDYLIAHLGNAAVRDLGEVAGHSSYNLSRLFRAGTGLSLKTFMNRFRVEAARVLLRTSHEKVETIATRVGLHDGSHLSRLFVRHTGLRPRDIPRPFS